MGARQMRFAEVQDDAVSYSSNTTIEGLSRDIVELLQEDGRAAFSTIAQKLGVSEATVRSRVARMKKSNLIHFVTVVNPLALWLYRMGNAWYKGCARSKCRSSWQNTFGNAMR